MADSNTNTIPEKKYFRIGEVCEITGLKPHVLRYWETEFKQVKPHKTKSKQRLYRKKDVETILLIKHLLYEQKFTIAGARSRIGRRKKSAKASPGPKQLAIEFDPAARDEFISGIIDELKDIKNFLDKKP